MNSQSSPPRLEDVILRLSADYVKETGKPLKLPQTEFHKIIADMAEKLREIGIKVNFRRTPWGLVSPEVEFAISRLTPLSFDVTNPTFTSTLTTSDAEAADAIVGNLNLSQGQLAALSHTFNTHMSS